MTNLLPINPSCWHLLLHSFNALLMKFFYSCSIISPGIRVRVTGGSLCGSSCFYPLKTLAQHKLSSSPQCSKDLLKVNINDPEHSLARSLLNLSSLCLLISKDLIYWLCLNILLSHCWIRSRFIIANPVASPQIPRAGVPWSSGNAPALLG